MSASVLSLTALLALSGCARAPAAPAAPPPQSLVLNREALDLIGQLDIDPVADTGGTDQEPLRALVGLGIPALSTMQHYIERSGGSRLRSLLLDAVARIDGAASFALLSQLAQSQDRGMREDVIGALHHRGAQALPLLHQMLAEPSTSDVSTRLLILQARYRAGDERVLGEVLAIGLGDAEHRWQATSIVSRHPPLRLALGLREPWSEWEFLSDELQFLRAADEWYRETVLGQESPWRQPPITAFTQPNADSKRAALAQLLTTVRNDSEHYGVLRVRAVDPTITAADGHRQLTVMTGSGHGQGLSLWVWQPEGTIVRGHLFLFERGAARTEFPEDCDGVRYGTVSLAADTYLNLIAGLQTILQAELMPWWSGPEQWNTFSSANFVVSIGGLRQPEQPPLQYCGYHTSSGWRNCAPLLAAAAWHRGFVNDPDAISLQPAAAASRPVFREAFLQTQPSWSDDSSWWWVRERMLLLAHDCGDSTLLLPLAAFLAPRFSNGGSSEGRTAAIAVSAIAAITGNDLRFAADGKPRPVADVAADYLERLAR